MIISYLIVLGLSVGRLFLPLWGWIIVTVVSISILFYVFKKISELREFFGRIDAILDEESNHLVTNHYKYGKLVKSTMKDTKGHIVYELEYSKGNVTKSRNFDSNGNVNVEQVFYENGQVHCRNEYINGKKITTEFDINGKKK